MAQNVTIIFPADNFDPDDLEMRDENWAPVELGSWTKEGGTWKLRLGRNSVRNA